MPASYHTQRPDLFDPKFARLSPAAKLVEWNVLNSRARTTEGLFRLPAAYVAVDMGLEHDQVLDGLKELEAEDYIGWDAEREIVLDKLALKWNPLKYGTDKDGNRKPDKRMVNALKLLHQVADSPLMFELFKLATHYSPDFAEALEEHFPFLPKPHKPLEALKPPKGGEEQEQETRRGRARARDEEEQEQESSSDASTGTWDGSW